MSSWRDVAVPQGMQRQMSLPVRLERPAEDIVAEQRASQQQQQQERQQSAAHEEQQRSQQQQM